MAEKLNQAIQLLRSADPTKRRKAIVYLARSGDEKAVKALGWSYKNDPDPELRELARKGGLALKKQLGSPDGAGPSDAPPTGTTSLLAYHKKATSEVQQVEASFAFDGGDDSANYDEYDNEAGYRTYNDEDEFGGMFTLDDDDEVDDPHGGMFTLDDDDDDYAAAEDHGPVNLDARKHIRRAMDYHIDEDDVAAVEELGKAVDRDRRTLQDSQAINIASNVTGLRGEGAMQMIASPVKRASLIARLEDQLGNRKSKQGIVGWGTAFADIGIFALISAVGSIVLILLGANRFIPALEGFSTTAQYQSWVQQSGNEDVIGFILNGLNSALFVLILIGLGITIINIILTFLQGLLLYVVATAGFGGEGTLAATIDRTFNATSVYAGLYFALLIGIVFALPVDAAVYQNIEANADAFNVANILNDYINPLLWFGYMVLLGVALGGAQRIGTTKGCLSVFVFTVGVFIVGCGCGFFLTMVGVASVPSGGF